ncbi:hypothetical protein [uncultured Methanospirillum sp.]|uniref:hypothetical protein n=1 Tax=uncultured Methanospirillum sp. TaxID=262503 RepID=UPI0029C6DD24|nr:hypothetical protein [uncultured Methanospirillum sp.]
MKKVSNSRFEESKILNKCHRYDGAVYLCGYSIEIALKVKICENYSTDFPESKREFCSFCSQSGFELKTHKLDTLLKNSNCAELIKLDYTAEWSVIASWDPEVRYRKIGSAKKNDAQNMIDSVQKIRGIL